MSYGVFGTGETEMSNVYQEIATMAERQTPNEGSTVAAEEFIRRAADKLGVTVVIQREAIYTEKPYAGYMLETKKPRN